MKYYVCNNLNEKIEILKIYNNLDDAYNGIIKCIKKRKNKVEIVPSPEINAGCDVYKADGSYYGTIASVTDNIISIVNKSQYMLIPDPFIKDAFQMLILRGVFIVVDGAEICSSDEMLNLMDIIKANVCRIKKSMDYIGAQQISFFRS